MILHGGGEKVENKRLTASAATITMCVPGVDASHNVLHLQHLRATLLPASRV